jgi:glycosyltransferase involved in cell wall biosynthesis
MRILIFNWKDIKHPAAGGAEVFTHEVGSRWVSGGHEVTLFCSGYLDATHEDEQDGIKIIRRGRRLSVYREAARWYRTQDRSSFDVVVDEINTRPFMTPHFVSDAPIVALIHQLAAEVWREETPPPISYIGQYFLEPRWLRQYRQRPTITVSNSSASDLRRLGFQRVWIVPEGMTHRLPLYLERESVPTLLFVGRLVSTKRPDHAVRAHKLILNALPQANLWIVGEGPLRRRLQAQADASVTFFGRVDDQRRQELMSRAHLLLVPGVREGWGLVVLEANAVGTPAVGYRIPGLVDSIRHGETGILVDPDPTALARSAVELLRSPARLEALSRGAIAWAERFDWDRTARDVLDILEKARSD